MTSPLFKLHLNDIEKGLIVTVLAAVFTFLASAISNPSFSFSTFDWNSLVHIALAAGFAYLAKNFFSDTNGKVFGKIG